MIRQIQNITNNGNRLPISFHQREFYSILVVRPYRKAAFLITMQSLKVERFEWKQVLFAPCLNKILHCFLIASYDLRLKSEFLQPSITFSIKVLQIVFIESYYHAIIRLQHAKIN